MPMTLHIRGQPLVAPWVTYFEGLRLLMGRAVVMLTRL
jgi:hypothetical protein